MGISFNVGTLPLRRLRRRAGVSLALLGAAAAFAPAAVAAEAPVPVPDATAIVDATLQATEPAALPDVEPVVEAVEELADMAVVPVEAAAPPPAPAQPAPAEAEKAAPPAAQTAAPAPEVAQKAAVPAPEAPAVSAEAQSEPTEPAAAPVADAVAAQAQPVNVNISIRVESPGDNGPVSQVNAAVAAVAAELAAAPVAGAPAPQEAQQQAPATQVEAPPPAPAHDAPESPAVISAGPTDQWDWTWHWNCGEVISPDIALPSTSSLPIWNWNWNWNCGAGPPASEESESEISSQYHGGARQYQPVNVNISIRVSSPGNDGAVSQANVAQTIVSVVTAATQQAVAVRPPTSASSPPVLSPQQPAATEAAPAQSFAALFVELSAEVAAAVPFELVVDLDCCAVPVPFVESAGGGHAGRGLAEKARIAPAASDIPFRAASGLKRRDITAAAAAIAQLAPVAPREVAALVVPKPKAEAARRAATHERLTKHVKHRAAPVSERVAALSYGGITPVGAMERNLKIMLLFLLPFVFALVAAARRVEGADRAAAAEPGRPEGRPG